MEEEDIVNQDSEGSGSGDDADYRDILDSHEKDVLEALLQVTAEGRTTAIDKLVMGQWDPSLRMTRVGVARGAFFKTMGRSIESQIHLDCLETLFLCDRGSLRVTFEGAVLSLQQLCSLCIDSLSLDAYLTYAFLKRLGYAVFLHSTSLSSTPQSSENGWWDWLASIFSPPATTSLPLVNTLDCHSVRQVFETLAVVPRGLPENLFDPNAWNAAPILLDVYKPVPAFKKSKRGTPDFRVAVASSSETLWPLSIRLALTHVAPITETKIAIVESSNITFIGIHDYDISVFAS